MFAVLNAFKYGKYSYVVEGQFGELRITEQQMARGGQLLVAEHHTSLWFKSPLCCWCPG